MATGLAQLNKSERKIAQSEMSKRARRTAEKYATRDMMNTAISGGSTVVAAAIDHRFRTGAEREARLGQPDSKFRPPVNGLIGLGATAVGLWAAANRKKWAGASLAVGIGAGAPALYNFTRDQLAK